ncbi:MAG: hypothetical protein ACI87C_002081 [Paraperlucidibaca sp.]|jgi:hypothetical protein
MSTPPKNKKKPSDAAFILPDDPLHEALAKLSMKEIACFTPLYLLITPLPK